MRFANIACGFVVPVKCTSVGFSGYEVEYLLLEWFPFDVFICGEYLLFCCKKIVSRLYSVSMRYAPLTVPGLVSIRSLMVAPALIESIHFDRSVLDPCTRLDPYSSYPRWPVFDGVSMSCDPFFRSVRSDLTVYP